MILADGGESAFQLICGEIYPGLFSRFDFIVTGIEVTRCSSLSLSPELQWDGIVCPAKSPGQVLGHFLEARWG